MDYTIILFPVNNNAGLERHSFDLVDKTNTEEVENVICNQFKAMADSLTIIPITASNPAEVDELEDNLNDTDDDIVDCGTISEMQQYLGIEDSVKVYDFILNHWAYIVPLKAEEVRGILGNGTYVYVASFHSAGSNIPENKVLGASKTEQGAIDLAFENAKEYYADRHTDENMDKDSIFQNPVIASAWVKHELIKHHSALDVYNEVYWCIEKVKIY